MNSIIDFEKEAVARLRKHLQAKGQQIGIVPTNEKLFDFNFDDLILDQLTCEIIPIEVALGGKTNSISPSQMDKFIVDALRLLWASNSDVNLTNKKISNTRYLILKSDRAKKHFESHGMGKRFGNLNGIKIEIFSAGFSIDEKNKLKDLYAEAQRKK